MEDQEKVLAYFGGAERIMFLSDCLLDMFVMYACVIWVPG